MTICAASMGPARLNSFKRLIMAFGVSLLRNPETGYKIKMSKLLESGVKVYKSAAKIHSGGEKVAGGIGIGMRQIVAKTADSSVAEPDFASSSSSLEEKETAAPYSSPFDDGGFWQDDAAPPPPPPLESDEMNKKNLRVCKS